MIMDRTKFCNKYLRNKTDENKKVGIQNNKITVTVFHF